MHKGTSLLKFKKRLLIMFAAGAMAFAFILSEVIMIIVGGKQEPPVNAAGHSAIAGTGVPLFNYNSGTKTTYTINNLAEISVGHPIFNFFGYDWYLTAADPNTGIATFWMTSPIAIARWSSTDYNGPNGTDAGDTGGVYNSNTYIHTLIKDGTFTNDGIIAAHGTIRANAGAAWSYVVPGTTANNDTTNGGKSNVIAAAVPSDEYLWLPSYSEVMDSGKWGMTATQRVYDRPGTTTASLIANSAAGSNSYSAHCWLRSPYSGASISTWYGYYYGGLDPYHVSDARGVRPAIHLNISPMLVDVNAIISELQSQISALQSE
jgi:hypothetical protein